MTPKERAEFWMCLIVEARRMNVEMYAEDMVEKLFVLVAEDLGIDVGVLKVLVD